MASKLVCDRRRASVENIAFIITNRLVVNGPTVKSWEEAETNEGAAFYRPVVEQPFLDFVTVRPHLNPRTYKISVEALGISVTLFLQDFLKTDSRFRDFSDGFEALYSSALAHPEMEPILATMS
ncbi:antirestriction protein [Microbulbifer epialgicus]|uniref:Antirestriction protein n=1 Tax=Microbulbifer epialgicus TaxID=393907 RepID=A0ABV4NTJ2_9GAMM